MCYNALSFNRSLIYETCNITPSSQNAPGSKSLGLFSSGRHMVNCSSHPPKKIRVTVLFKMFSIIRIDKQSLNHKFWGSILILSAPCGWLRTKCLCHTTFFHQFCTFSVCFCGNTDVALDSHCGFDGFILTIWTLSSCEIVKLKLIMYIPQPLYIIISESWNAWFLCSICLVYHLSPAYWSRQIILAKYLFSK